MFVGNQFLINNPDVLLGIVGKLNSTIEHSGQNRKIPSSCPNRAERQVGEYAPDIIHFTSFNFCHSNKPQPKGFIKQGDHMPE